MEYSQKDCNTRTEEAKLIFMKGVSKDFIWMNDKARGKALLLVEEIIYSHSVEVDSDNTTIRQWSGLQKHRKRRQYLRNMLRQETAHEIRTEIRHEIRKEVWAKVS